MFQARAASIFMAVLFVLSACAGEDDVGIGAQPGEARTEAEVAGIEAGQLAGEPVEVPQKTIGFLSILGTAEAAQRPEEGLKEAAVLLGWEVQVCDGKGDPRQFAICMNSLVTQDLDAIVLGAIEPSTITRGLREADGKDIPIINTTGDVNESPLIDAEYVLDEKETSKVLTDRIISDLDGAGKVGALIFPGIKTTADRYEQFSDQIAETDIEVVAEHTVDLANVVEDTKRAVTSMLSAHPDLDAVWGAFDINFPSMAEAVRSAGKEDVRVYGFYGTLINLETIRNGTGTAIAEWANEAGTWIAADQLANLFARNEPIDPNAPADYPFDFMAPQLITKENVPEEGYFPPPADFVSFFTAKWSEQYTNVNP